MKAYLPKAKASNTASTLAIDHATSAKSTTNRPGTELLDLFDVTLDNSAAIRRQHQTLIPDVIHRSGPSHSFNRAQTNKMDHGFKRGPLAENMMPALVEEQAGQHDVENGLAWEGFESLQISPPDADDRDLSNSSRSDSGDETEGDDQKTSGMTSGMTSGLTRDEIDEDSRTHMSDQSYDSDDSDDDAEYEHVSRSSESEESEADDHDPDYPSGHHCVQTARLQDPISTTMDVADVTDDDDAYEIGILLRLGANGKPIWPKDFSTMYRPKSFRRGVNYLDEPLKKGEKWVRLPDGKCCGSCQEWADREWQPKKGDKNWYPKLGCMVKVPVAFDPARDPAPPIEGGCAQCRCKNMAIDCTLATQNHPDGEVVERFPPPKIKVAKKLPSPKRSKGALVPIPVPINTMSPPRQRTKPSMSSPSKRVPASAFAPTDNVQPARPFHARSLSTVSGSGNSSYSTALSYQSTATPLIENIDLMSSSAADSYDTHQDLATWLTCLRLLELVGENLEVEGGLSVMSYKRLRWVVEDGIGRGCDVPVKGISKSKGKASTSSRVR